MLDDAVADPDCQIYQPLIIDWDSAISSGGCGWKPTTSDPDDFIWDGHVRVKFDEPYSTVRAGGATGIFFSHARPPILTRLQCRSTVSMSTI